MRQTVDLSRMSRKYFDLLDSVEIIFDSQKPESVTFDVNSVRIVQSSDLKK